MALPVTIAGRNLSLCGTTNRIPFCLLLIAHTRNAPLYTSLCLDHTQIAKNSSKTRSLFFFGSSQLKSSFQRESRNCSIEMLLVMFVWSDEVIARDMLQSGVSPLGQNIKSRGSKHVLQHVCTDHAYTRDLFLIT